MHIVVLLNERKWFSALFFFYFSAPLPVPLLTPKSPKHTYGMANHLVNCCAVTTINGKLHMLDYVLFAAYGYVFETFDVLFAGCGCVFLPAVHALQPSHH